MNRCVAGALVLALLLATDASMGQSVISVGGISSPLAGSFGPPGSNVPFDNTQLNSTMLNREAERDLSPLENPAISVSKLDFKAPGRARREYDKGSQLLARKDYQNAAAHLNAAISIYPDFVAAHNALGSSFLSMGQNEQARDEFTKAVSLDDHLPISHMNLGCAELALKQYSAAEESVKKAASIAPMDLQVLTALGYAQLMNHDYAGVIATTQEVHGKKHKDASIVHYYAAAAYDNQSNLAAAQHELETFLREDPKSPAASQAHDILVHLHDPIAPVTQASSPAPVFSEAPSTQAPPAPGQLPPQMRKLLQESKEKQQITEAEAMCESCETTDAADASSAGAAPSSGKPADMHSNGTGWTLRSTVDEVAVLFAATDHGNSVEGLDRSDIKIRDDRKTPTAITGFLSESQLPLRLGIVIDTSESVTGRFAFQQKAATNFLQKVVTNPDDLAFVVGFSNSILLVQDFTGDQTQLSHGISQLAPAGGTALWDAVSFAADKLVDKSETRPVARILVVISDGEDNSSSTTLKEAIEAAERQEVIVYTVSTKDNRDIASGFSPTSYGMNDEIALGDRALKTLADRTGGAAFSPGSIGGFNHSLADLQQVIRSRYLVSYKPAIFKTDGRYHTVDIVVTKSGRKLHVYARKGYYASIKSGSDGGSL